MQMIPKIIHYCWFGHGEMTPLMKKCIKSWEKYCKGWEIKEWNEDNIDINSMPLYVRQAYEKKKWGFVPDYIRLWIIYNYGGVYLDTDVEIIRPIDRLLEYHAYAGFEDCGEVALGLGFGAEAGNPIIKKIMDSYESLSFLNEDGTLNLVPSPKLNTQVLVELGLQKNNSKQKIGDMVILPADYLCPRSFYTGECKCTENTYTIHQFAASWYTKEQQKTYRKRLTKFKRRRAIRKLIVKMIGYERYNSIRKN